MRKIYQTNNGLQEVLEGQDFLIQDNWIKLTDAEVEAIINPPITEEQIINKYESIYENIFTQKLIELDYKQDGSTVSMYASTPTSIYYNECISLINWREAMVNKNYEILNAVKNGTRTLPTEAEYIAELPIYTA